MSQAQSSTGKTAQFLGQLYRAGHQVVSFGEFLHDKGRLMLLSVNEFCQRIQMILGESSKDFIEYFHLQIAHQQNNKLHKSDFYLPYLVQNNKNYQRENLKRFMQVYMKSEKIENKMQKRYSQWMIPSFIFDKIKAVEALLSVNVTNQFEDELQEVVKLIETQIKNNEITRFYADIVANFLEFQEITNAGDLGQFQGMMDDYFKPQSYASKCIYGGKSSPLMQQWKTISPAFIERAKNKRPNKQTINECLLRGLSRIFLTFSPNLHEKIIYGCTVGQYIFVNVNLMSSEMNINTFRNGPLRAYLAITIYHQLTHFLLYQLKLVKDSQQAFKPKQGTLGTFITSFIRSVAIPQGLTLKPKTTGRRKCCSIERLTKNSLAFFENHKQVVGSLMNTKDALKLIYEDTCALSAVLQNMKNESFADCLAEMGWNKVFQYIKELQPTENEELDLQMSSTNPQITKQHLYRFFFVVFMSEEIMRELKIDEYEYATYRQILARHKMKAYYTKKCQQIEAFLSLLNYLKLPKDKTTNSLIICICSQLSRRVSAKSIDQEVSKLWKQFTPDKADSYVNQVTGNILQKVKFLPNLSFSDYLNIDQFDNLQAFLNTSKTLLKMLRMQEIHDKLNTFIKHSEILTILQDLPLNKIQFCQFLFPQLLKSKKIFSKDYQYFCDISGPLKRTLIGTRPKIISYKMLYISLNGNKVMSSSFINLEDGCCRKKFLL